MKLRKNPKKKVTEFEPIYLGLDEQSAERYKRNSQNIVKALESAYAILNQEQFKQSKEDIYNALKEGRIEPYIESTLKESSPAFQSISYDKLLSLFSIDIVKISSLQLEFSKLIKSADIEFIDGSPITQTKEFPYHTSTKEQNDLCAYLFLQIDCFNRLSEYNPNLNKYTFCQALLNMLKIDTQGKLSVNPQAVLSTVKYRH